MTRRSLNRESVDAGREQRLDRRRRPHRRVVGPHGDELLEEERVSLGGVHHLLAPHLGAPPDGQSPEQAGRVGVGQRLEPDDAAAAACGRPLRAAFEQVAAREADDQDRRPGVGGDVLDEVEHRRLGPVDVVEGGDQRAAAGERLEEAADGPLHVLLGRARAVLRPAAAATRDATTCGCESSDRRLSMLGSRSPARSFTISISGQYVIPSPYGQAAPDDDRRLVLDAGGELLQEARLPDPGRPRDRDEHAPVSLHRAAEPGRQPSQLGAPADERDRRAAREPPGRVDEPLDLPHAKRPPLPLRLDRPVRAQANRALDEPAGLRADDDAARRRRGLEPGGRVDGVAGDEPVAGDTVDARDLAGVDADPELEADTEVVLELAVQLGHRVAHLDGRAHRAERVVLVQHRDPEDGHDRVADVLLDGAAVALERPAHGGEVAGLEIAERLWVEPLAHGGGAGEVGEDDRDGLSHLRRGRGPPTPGTDFHRTILREPAAGTLPRHGARLSLGAGPGRRHPDRPARTGSRAGPPRAGASPSSST